MYVFNPVHPNHNQVDQTELLKLRVLLMCVCVYSVCRNFKMLTDNTRSNTDIQGQERLDMYC